MKPEPFRIKMVEAISLLSREERERLIKEAGYNVFQLKIDDVYIDLLTDSGTGAMSDKQWAAMLEAKQAYAGSNAYYMLKEVVKNIFGFKYFVPVHQGRPGEHILFANIVKPGDIIPNNSHFDTTRANVKLVAGIPKDFAIKKAYETEKDLPPLPMYWCGGLPFKGNMDLEKLEDFLNPVRKDEALNPTLFRSKEQRLYSSPSKGMGFSNGVKKNKDNVPLIMMTITNNTVGGQPVSILGHFLARFERIS